MGGYIFGFFAAYGLLCAVRNVAEAVNRNDLINKVLGYVKENVFEDDTPTKTSLKRKN